MGVSVMVALVAAVVFVGPAQACTTAGCDNGGTCSVTYTQKRSTDAPVATKTLVFTNVPLAPLVLDIESIADYSTTTEHVTLSAPGYSQIFFQTGSDCSVVTDSTTLTLAQVLDEAINHLSYF